MLKKPSLILMILCSALLSQPAVANRHYNFNPEEIHFSRISTLRSWAAKKHYVNNDDFLKTLQQLVAKTLRQNPSAYNFVFPIENDPKVKQNYGNSLLTIAEIELPFLQFVHKISKTKNPITLEIAAGAGWTSWKVPLAFQDSGTHYVNDLSNKMYEHIINNREIAEKMLNIKSLSLSTVDLQGDCFDILKKHPELKNKVDAIFVANLEHFFNPTQHQEFLVLINELLAPGGQAFLYADSFLFGPDNYEHPLYKLYKEQEIGQNLYPGFMQYYAKWQTANNGKQIVPGSQEFLNITRPEDDNNYISKPIKARRMNNDLIELETYIRRNFFSPQIYSDTIALHPTLQVLDTFFLDKKNNRLENWIPVNNEPLHAAIIIKEFDNRKL